MGTIVYQSLLTLLLDEQDYSLKEIYKIAEERYGFEEKHIKLDVGLIVRMGKMHGNIIELPDGKFNKKGPLCRDMSLMLGGPEILPEDYFGRTDPKRRQFYLDLQERYGHLRRPEPKEQVEEDWPF